MKHLLALFIFLTLTQGLRVAAAESPRISRLSPTAIQPGKSIEVTFFGEHLAAATNLWTSFECASTLVKSSASELVFRLTAASNAPVQIGAVRLVGANVLSNLQLLMVDDLPTE